MDAEKEMNKKQEAKKISSPYTIIKPKKKNKKPVIYGILLLLITILLVMLLFNFIRPKKDKTTIELKSRIEGEIYELT